MVFLSPPVSTSNIYLSPGFYYYYYYFSPRAIVLLLAHDAAGFSCGKGREATLGGGMNEACSRLNPQQAGKNASLQQHAPEAAHVLHFQE